jgi:hypothetical protein
VYDWEGWWQAIGDEPAFAESLGRRRRRFSATHPAEFIPPESWHVERLLRAGYSEAAVVWRRYGDAVVAAIR